MRAAPMALNLLSKLANVGQQISDEFNVRFQAIRPNHRTAGTGAIQPKLLRFRNCSKDTIGISVIEPTLMVSISSAAINS
jgi:hypothetical protein